MPQRWIERERAIMNGIMSLLSVNCDALNRVNKAKVAIQQAPDPAAKALAEAELAEAGNQLYEEVARKVRPTLHVCADEQQQFSKDLADVRFENGNLRTAVETVISNQHAVPAENDIVMAALRTAAPGHAFL